jgi:hypothetical protein
MYTLMSATVLTLSMAGLNRMLPHPVNINAVVIITIKGIDRFFMEDLLCLFVCLKPHGKTVHDTPIYYIHAPPFFHV